MKNTLIATYSLFILFLVGSAIYAAKTFDGDVDNAYEKGMQYAIDLEKSNKLGWQFSIINHNVTAGTSGNLELIILDKNDAPVQGAEVSLELSLLTKPEALPSQAASENKPGHYLASVNLPTHGHWQVDTKTIYNEEVLLNKFKIYIEKGK